MIIYKEIGGFGYEYCIFDHLRGMLLYVMELLNELEEISDKYKNDTEVRKSDNEGDG